MTRDKDRETTQVKHAGSRADDDDDDRCPCAECGLVGSATLARDLEREEVDESVPLERALVLEESGGPCGAAQPAQSSRAEWSTIPTPTIAGMRWEECWTTFETLVVGSAVANDAMGAPEKTRLPVRPSLNPWSTTERKWYLASLPSDGVIEHRAIIAPRTPPREPRQEKAAQAEEARAEWSTIPQSSASAEAAPEVGVGVPAKVKRPYSEVSAQAAALLSQRGPAHLLGGGPQPATDGSGTAGGQEKRQRMAHIQENMKASDLAGNPQVFDQE